MSDLNRSATGSLSWFGIFRLGLVQTALGAVVVLTTSTINRAMVVELALPATLPGLLVAIHYAMQMLRPRMGHGSDAGGKRTPWIMGGMAVLALGGTLAAAATGLLATHFWPGIALSVLAFVMIGAGVGAAGTSLLTLLAGEAARRAALREVWAEPAARQFTVFVFVSMLAYSAADLILEPFAGEVFGLTIGASTALAGQQNAGTALGMMVVGLIGSLFAGRALGSLRGWCVAGCLASAVMLALLAGAKPGFPLGAAFFLLGVANGVFAAAAIALMMQLADREGESRAGMRMGLWGAAQAIAFGLGGLAGTVLCDLGRLLTGAAAPAYAMVFVAEAAHFIVSAVLAWKVAPIVRAEKTGAIACATHLREA